jgi:hypothetical protein
MRALMEETSAMIARGQLQPDPIEPWWERRRENEQTPDYLGRVLDEAGLPDLARDARAAHYDDFHAPAEVADGLEILRLVRDLRKAARAEPEKGRSDRRDRERDAPRRVRRDEGRVGSVGGEQGRAGHVRRARRADGDAVGAEGGTQRPVPVRVGPQVQAMLRSVMR